MIPEQQTIHIKDQSELWWSVLAGYNTDKQADGSKNEKRLEKAEQSSEREAEEQKKNCVKPAAVKQGTSFVSNPPTRNTALSVKQTG